MLNNLSTVKNIKTRSISAENFTGEKGMGGMATEGTGADCARDLGQGWKVNPYIVINSGDTAVLADVSGQGAIKHIWITFAGGVARDLILRIYWDGAENPSVEVPLGDFFASARDEYRQLSSLAVCNNPGRAFNCWVPGVPGTRRGRTYLPLSLYRPLPPLT